MFFRSSELVYIADLGVSLSGLVPITSLWGGSMCYEFIYEAICQVFTVGLFDVFDDLYLLFLNKL